jgi:hypothetical protein
MTTQFLHLSSVAKQIELLGKTNTFLVEGQPGIGKSAILHGLDGSKYKKFRLDCARIQDSADVLFPFVDIDEKTVKFVIVGMLAGLMDAIKAGEPVALMLDELGKAPRVAMNALITLLVDRYIDQYALPEGSLVFATTNLSTDGVGDNIPAHIYNRMTTVKCCGPTVKEWMMYAARKNISPALIAWANNTHEAFDTYAMGTRTNSGIPAEDNKYIFRPTDSQLSKFFCSPRSLEMASSIVESRSHLTEEEFSAALAGTVGTAAAASIQTYITFADTLPPFEEVVNNPTTTRVPTGVPALVSAIILATRLTPENGDALITYVGRFDTDEPKALFTSMMGYDPYKNGWLAKNKKFAEMTSMISSQILLTR